MQAFILAGGKGTRLQPYTMSFPKPLMPIGDCPILEIVIRQLARQGFERVTISTGHLAELIGAYFGDGARWDIAIDYLREDKPLSTAGPLGLLDEFDEPLLVMNGDVLTTMDYAMLVKEHEDRGAKATVAVTQRTVPVDFGVVKFDEDDLLSEWIEKPQLPYWVSTGVYVTSPAARALVGAGEPLSMPDLLLRVKASGGSVFCARSDAFWLDIGRVEDYQQAQDEFESRRNEFLGEKA